MKKVIILLLLMVCIPTALAEENYIRKYKYYRINKVYGSYSKEAAEDYPFRDLEDYIYTDYIESETFPQEVDGREIITETLYEYERIKDVNYIEITNYDSTLNVSSLELKYKGNELPFTTDAPVSVIESSTRVTLYLDEPVDPTQISLIINSDAVDAHLALKEGFDEVMYARQDVYIGEEFTWNGYNATYNSTSGIGDIWTTDTYFERQTTSRIMKYKGSINRYKYRDILFHTYREEREYYEDYLIEPIGDFTYKDEYDYIDVLNIIPGKPEAIEETIISDKPDATREDEDITLDETDIILNVEEVDYSEVIDVPNTGISHMETYSFCRQRAF